MTRLIFSLYLVSVTVGLQGSESSCVDGSITSSWLIWTCVNGTTATRNGYCEDSMHTDITETAKNCSTCGHKSVQDGTESKFVSCCDDSVSWTQPWTCDSTTFKTASRVGECTSDGVPGEVTRTVNVSVYSWTSWSPWLPRCGSDHRSRSRSCEVPSSDVPFCSTCGYQNVTASQRVPANLPPCCENYPFGAWSPWKPDCSLPVSGVTPVNQSRTRSRECNISSDCTPCPVDVETRTGVLQSWNEWGEWSGSLRPCSEKVYRSRRRSCPNVTNPDGYPVTSCCNSSSEDVEYSCNGSVATTLCTLSSVSPTADTSVWTLSSVDSTVATDDVFSTSAETELSPSFSQSTQEHFPLKLSSTAIFHSFIFSSAASTTSSPSEPSPIFSTTTTRLSPSRASSSAPSPAFPSAITSSGPVSMPSSPATSHTPVFSSTTSESINISPSEPSSIMIISFTTYSHVLSSSAHSPVELSSILKSSFFTTMTLYAYSPGPLVTLSSAIISLSPLSSSATHSYASMTNNIHSPSIFSLASSTTRPSPSSKLRSTTTSLHFPSSSSVVLTPSQRLRSSTTASTALRSGPVTSSNSLSLHLPLFPVSSSPVGDSPTGSATGPPGYVWGVVAAVVLVVVVVATVVVGLAVRKCVHLYRKRREGYVRVLTSDDEDMIYPI